MSMRANFGGSTCNSSIVPSSWDESETTDRTSFSFTETNSDSEDDLIKGHFFSDKCER